MPILTDQCIHKDVVLALKEAGFKVVSAEEAKLQSAFDSAIYDYAIKNKCILLTFDKDFGNVLRFNMPRSFGVIIIYIEDMSKEEIVKSSLDIFKNFDESKLKGKLFIVDKNKIRIWPK